MVTLESVVPNLALDGLQQMRLRLDGQPKKELGVSIADVVRQTGLLELFDSELSDRLQHPEPLSRMSKQALSTSACRLSTSASATSSADSNVAPPANTANLHNSAFSLLVRRS
jgi:hypothetical protein